MKTKILTFLLVFTIVAIQQSCRKDDTNLDVDLSKYNPDGFVKGELDEWLTRTLTDPYNIEVTYRFNRNLGDVSRNIAPPDISKVKPTAEMVLNGFLKVYENVAGAPFIKQTTPKHFVFFGSTSYNTNGTMLLGTASQGRRITLYNLNTLDASDYENVKRRLRTIHHEYTHILNQLVVIPPSFELVTPGDYTSDWTGRSEQEAKDLGFISQYARDQFAEDFAETAAHLIVEGQEYYDAYVASAPASAQEKLRRKETIVVDYFKQAFNIDFRELQRVYQEAVVTHYNAPRPVDPESALGYLKTGRIADISVDLVNGEHYVAFGKSDDFQAVWEEVVATMPTLSGRQVQSLLTFRFVENGYKLIVDGRYTNTAGSTFQASFDFPVTYLPNGHIKFTYVQNDGTGAYGNGRTTLAGWKPLLDYLEAHEFVPDWLPTNAGPENFRKFAGFYVDGDEDNYFYGPVVLN